MEEKVKYNLTFWQRIQLIPIWLFWVFHRPRKTWHIVKKGMEYHEHTYETPFYVEGYLFYNCNHEGCTCCSMHKTYTEYDGVVYKFGDWRKFLRTGQS